MRTTNFTVLIREYLKDLKISILERAIELAGTNMMFEQLRNQCYRLEINQLLTIVDNIDTLEFLVLIKSRADSKHEGLDYRKIYADLCSIINNN